MQSEGWTYEVHELSEGFSAIVYDQHGQMVADHLTEERARLIAEAPNKSCALSIAIEAMEKAKDEWFSNTHTPTQCGYMMNAHLSGALRKIRAALSLARDREPG